MKLVDKVIKQLEIKLKIKDSIEEVIANDNTAQETSRYGLLITKYYENEISCNYEAYT